MHDKLSYHQPVINFARKDFTALDKNLTVDESLKKIRTEGVGERIVYFYVVDEEKKLAGVLPTRRLLTGRGEQKIEELMVKRVAALPKTATVYDACEFFVTYKFLAFPVVDEERKLLGIVDVNLFTEELLEEENADDEEKLQSYDDIFETIGFRLSELKNASPLKAWRVRFPWLLVTVSSGTVAALLTGMFQSTLAGSLVLALFLALVLGLGESVSIQSMAVTIQMLHTTKPSLKWYIKNFLREAQTALMLGGSCAALVFTTIVLWKNNLLSAVVISSSIVLVEFMAAIWGLSVPALLHKTKLDPKISAGPITLALTDIGTILFYFGLATLLLKK